MSTIDEKILQLRQMRIEADTQSAASSVIEQGLLSEIQVVLEGLRREVAMRSARTFSEGEMAQWLGCTERQLREYRLKHRETVKPIMVTRTPRYSTWHQVNAQEIFKGVGSRGSGAGRKSRPRSNVISDPRLQTQERRRVG